MAFPVVATTNTTADTDGTSTVINMPASISAGDLLIVWDTNDATGTARSQSGGSDWTRISTGANGTVISMAIFAKIAAGGDTLTLAGAAQDSATVSARITGHGVTNVSIDIMIGTPATGNDAAPNPPNVAHGGPQDYLVLESAHSDDDDDTATYWSSGYSAVGQVQSASSTTSCLTSVGQLAVSNTAENPGVMALAAAEEWVAQTISIPPAVTYFSKLSDAFTQGDENPLSSGGVWDGGYTSLNNLQLVGNDVRATVASATSLMTTDNYLLPDAQWASAVIPTIQNAGVIVLGVVLRSTAPATVTHIYGSAQRNTADKSRIVTVEAGAGTVRASETATTWAAGDAIRVSAIGTRLTLQRKPSGGAYASLLTAVNGNITTGTRAGMRILSDTLADAEFDTYDEGDFVAESTGSSRLMIMGVGR